MDRYPPNEFSTMRQEEARSGSSSRPSPLDPLDALVPGLCKVAMWILCILGIIALVQAALSGQPLDGPSGGWV